MEYTGFDINFSLQGKAALITGGATGIGRAIAELYAQKGADIALMDVREDVALVAREIGSRGVRSIPLVADVTVKDQVEKAVAQAVDELGKIDILVNNAGVGMLDDAETMSEEIWDTTMAVNLKGPFLVAQAVGNHMIKRGGGKIINLASQAALVALDRHAAYCASKAGLLGLTKVLAMEWAEFNITVNAISPTVILTELGKKAWAGEVGEAAKKRIPLRRFGYPEEVAAVALFLGCDASNLMTGENVVIDGGYTIQ